MIIKPDYTQRPGAKSRDYRIFSRKTSALLVIVAASFMFLCPSFAMEDVRESLVKIYAVQNQPDYNNPWNMLGPEEFGGSGCVIEGNRILTNAHMVSDLTFIQVRLHGRPRKHTATVVAVSHEADLALLTVENESFFEGIRPLVLGDLPQVQQEVVVYGFPLGGDTLSTTKGVISRIEHQRYAHSDMELLAGQLDAAVNPGNSGGPVMAGDRVVGVVMQSLSASQGIGYMVPVPIIRHFLEDMKDGRYDGFPEEGLVYQGMENSTLKMMYGLKKEQTGLLVTSVLPGTPSEGKVFPDDVVLEVDGHKLADDGTVEFRSGERTSASYIVQQHQVGEEITLEILRKGKEQEIRLTLDQAWGRHTLVPMPLYDVMPTYYIYGGLVFAPLTLNFLMTWSNESARDAPPNLVNYFINNRPDVKGEEVVVLIKILSAEVNNGYQQGLDTRIIEVNGKKINNLRDLIQTIENSASEPYVVFKNEHGLKMVMDRKVVHKEQQDVLKTYRVPSDRSADLKL